jgi:PKD repeat protein
LTVLVGSDPVASFTFTPAAPTVASGVNFDGTASTAAAGRTITVYSWNFGDTLTATGSKPSHSYAAAGTYTVTLTVTDSAGRTATATQSVRINP